MTARKTTVKKTTRRVKTGGRSGLDVDLPPTLREFGTKVRRNLNRLERDMERAQARGRRQGARLLRDASHRLGHLEAQGERNWRKLNARARRETLSVLRRLERAVEGSGRKKPAARKKPATRKKPAARKKKTARRRA